MKRLFLFFILINSSFLLMAQKPMNPFKETKQLPNGKFQLIEKNKSGDTLIVGLLSTINPEVRDGEFSFYNNNKLEAKGYYSGDVPSGVWSYYDSQGNIIKTVNYDKTIEFLNSDTIKIKEEFLLVEEMPYYLIKNSDSFKKYIQENLVYPIYALKKNISDRVFLKFTVAENGKICHISIARSAGNLDLNIEALRLMTESPLWVPGKQKGKPVSVVYSFPVTFEIIKPSR